MVLSTVGENNRPSSRVVLLKGIDDEGLRFFTSYNSRKGMELAGNPYAAINFYWPEMERQVRFEGAVELLTEEESIKYFDSRPEESRINAIISPQSQTIPDRDFLINESEKLKEKLDSGSTELSKPSSWGGYIFKPYQIEFWQGRPGRLNDRILYNLENEVWEKNILAP